MTNTSYVVDASVAVKWFSQTGEDDIEKALRLQELYLQRECALTAPDLIIYELANALRYNPNFDQKDTELALLSLHKMGMELVAPSETLLKKAVEFAYQKNITVYDAIYVALALERRCLLITADTKSYKKIRDFSQVILLKDW